MFQKNNKISENGGASINLIGNGTSIVGDINSNGDVRIDGNLKGNIIISGKLVVGDSGNIEGSIECQNADISGIIHGKITVIELLTLKSSAKLTGDIITSKIAIEPNALFTGTCNMGEAVKTITNAKNSREPAQKTA